VSQLGPIAPYDTAFKQNQKGGPLGLYVSFNIPLRNYRRSCLRERHENRPVNVVGDLIVGWDNALSASFKNKFGSYSNKTHMISN